MAYGKVESLAIAQALYNKLGEVVSTKDPSSLRSELDGFFKGQYELTGAKSFDVKIGEDSVGTYSVVTTKEKPAETVQQFEVRSYLDLARWFDGVPDSEIRDFVAKDLQVFAEYWFAENGELPDGCGLNEIVILAQPKQYKCSKLVVSPEKVLEALQGQLPQAVRGLLGDAQ